MTQKQVDYIKDQFSTRWNSPLRNLFYTKRGLPRQKLYTKQQIMDALSLPEPDNLFEKQGIDQQYHSAMSRLRNEAKNHGIAFIDLRIEHDEGQKIYYHGFSRDIDKAEHSISLYEERLEQSERLYKVTYDVATSQIQMLEQEPSGRLPAKKEQA